MTTYFKNCKEVVEKRKVHCIMLVVCFAVGIILGIFLSGNERVMFSQNAVDYLLIVLRKESSCFSLVVRRVCLSAVLFLIFALCGLVIFLYPLHFLLITYRGYILGAAAVALVQSFGITGAILFLFTIMIQNVATSLGLIIFSTIALDFLKSKGKCKVFNYQKYVVTCLICFAVSLVGIIVEFLLLLLVFRPLNFYF